MVNDSALTNVLDRLILQFCLDNKLTQNNLNVSKSLQL